jgi:hypothetical protein
MALPNWWEVGANIYDYWQRDEGLEDAGNTLAAGYDQAASTIQEYADPWVDAGLEALEGYQGLGEFDFTYDDYLASENYQWLQDETMRQGLRNQAAQKMLGSGNTLVELQDRAAQVAGTQYGQEHGRQLAEYGANREYYGVPMALGQETAVATGDNLAQLYASAAAIAASLGLREDQLTSSFIEDLIDSGIIDAAGNILDQGLGALGITGGPNQIPGVGGPSTPGAGAQVTGTNTGAAVPNIPAVPGTGPGQLPVLTDPTTGLPLDTSPLDTIDPNAPASWQGDSGAVQIDPATGLPPLGNIGGLVSLGGGLGGTGYAAAVDPFSGFASGAGIDANLGAALPGAETGASSFGGALLNPTTLWQGLGTGMLFLGGMSLISALPDILKGGAADEAKTGKLYNAIESDPENAPDLINRIINGTQWAGEAGTNWQYALKPLMDNNIINEYWPAFYAADSEFDIITGRLNTGEVQPSNFLGGISNKANTQSLGGSDDPTLLKAQYGWDIENDTVWTDMVGTHPMSGRMYDLIGPRNKITNQFYKYDSYAEEYQYNGPESGIIKSFVQDPIKTASGTITQAQWDELAQYPEILAAVQHVQTKANPEIKATHFQDVHNQLTSSGYTGDLSKLENYLASPATADYLAQFGV